LEFAATACDRGAVNEFIQEQTRQVLVRWAHESFCCWAHQHQVSSIK